jgi:hypothetical protein
MALCGATNPMNDPLFAARSYACEKSRKARDAWLAFRASQGMPVVQHLDRFADVPGSFAKQWAAARELK